MNGIISDFIEKGIKWQKGFSRAKQIGPAERNKTTPYANAFRKNC